MRALNFPGSLALADDTFNVGTGFFGGRRRSMHTAGLNVSQPFSQAGIQLSNQLTKCIDLFGIAKVLVRK